MTDAGRDAGMKDKIIQLQPWRDVLLGLTEQGEIYVLTPENTFEWPRRGFLLTLVWPGMPQE